MSGRGAALLAAVIASVADGCATGQDLQHAPAAVYHLSEGGGRAEIAPSDGMLQVIVPYSPRFDLVVSGRRASYRTADRQPTFVAAGPADDVILVRLRPGSRHDDRNVKIRVLGSGVVISDEDLVDAAADPEGGGLRLRPRQALQPGEYAILSRASITKTPGRVRMFGFGVD